MITTRNLTKRFGRVEADLADRLDVAEALRQVLRRDQWSMS